MRQAIRNSLVALVHADFIAAYPTVAIVYDNAPFDRNNPPPVWVEYEARFAGGNQVGMSETPLTRVHGFLYVTVWTKTGTGTKAGNEICDWFANRVQYRSIGQVSLQAAEPFDESSPPTGWSMACMKAYFYTKPT